MKQLNNYILEKLRLTKDIDYCYHPKDKEELQSLLEKLLKERGPNADLTDIDTSNITNMYSLFHNFEIENINISTWDVSNVTDISYLFFGCTKFNCDLSKWDVSNVENMSYAFYNCQAFNSNLPWNTTSLIESSSMFEHCSIFEGNGLENWDVRKLHDANYMFHDCQKFNGDLSSWQFKNIMYTDNMFRNCSSFEGKGLEYWNVSGITDMRQMFANCYKLKCNLENWNVNTDFAKTSDMFYKCTSLKKLPTWYE